jgi:hypothetical protein
MLPVTLEAFVSLPFFAPLLLAIWHEYLKK